MALRDYALVAVIFVFICAVENDAQIYKEVTVQWEDTQNRWYYAQLNGTKAHSWRDAFNLCARLRPGNPFPAIFFNETGIERYLRKKYQELKIDPGTTKQRKNFDQYCNVLKFYQGLQMLNLFSFI